MNCLRLWRGRWESKSMNDGQRLLTTTAVCSETEAVAAAAADVVAEADADADAAPAAAVGKGKGGGFQRSKLKSAMMAVKMSVKLDQLWKVDSPETRQLLTTVPILQHLDEEALTKLTTQLEIERYEQDQTILSQGEAGHCMYFMADGDAKAEVEGVGVVKLYKRGDFFGELALTDTGFRSATVTAGWGGARVFVLSREAFVHTVLDDDVIGVLAAEKADYSSHNRLLSKVPILQHLNEEGLTALAEQLTIATFEPQQQIIKMGEEGGAMYFLADGDAIAEVDGVGVVKNYDRSDFFGELALTDWLGVRAATVKAGSGGARCLVLSRDAFESSKIEEGAGDVLSKQEAAYEDDVMTLQLEMQVQCWI